METKFTPGPWLVDEACEVIAPSGYVLAEVFHSFDDANLIAAAPALYGALTDCVLRLRACAAMHGSDDWAIDGLCGPFEAALALARGEHRTPPMMEA